MSIKVENIGDYLVVRNQQSYRNVATFDSVDDIITKSAPSVVVLKYFRYSINFSSFSDWLELTTTKLNEINALLQGKDQFEFWLDFKFQLGGTSGYFEYSSVSLGLTLIPDKFEEMPNQVYEVLQEESRYKPIETFHSTFDIYNQIKTFDLNRQMSYYVNELFGHNVAYYKADPIYESKDSLLMEWGLMNYRDGKHIKIMLPDNSFPDPSWTISPIEGVNFEQPFEIHIDKNYFEQEFGVNQRPQTDDALFIDRMDRFYLILDCELVRSFMNKPVYYKCNLVKFTKKSYISGSPETMEQFDNAATSFTELLGMDIKEEMMDATNRKQLTIKSNRFDPVMLYKENFNTKLVTDYELMNDDIIVSHNYYDFNRIYIEDGRIPCVFYNIKEQITELNTRTLTNWFYLKEEKKYSKPIISVVATRDEIILDFEYNLPTNFRVGDLVKIYKKDNTFSFNVIITEILFDREQIKAVWEFDTDYTSITTDVPDWQSFTNLFFEKIIVDNFIGNIQDHRGFSIDLINYQNLRIRFDDYIQTFTLANPLEFGKWYSIILTISHELNQFSYYIYTPQENKNDLKLVETFNCSLDIFDEVDRSIIYGNNEMFILASPLIMTNIRWLNSTIIEEKHSIFLNQILVSDSSKCLIIDNCEQKNSLPYIGSAK